VGLVALSASRGTIEVEATQPEIQRADAIFSAPPDFHRTGLSSRGYYAGAEKMAPLKRYPLRRSHLLNARTREQRVSENTILPMFVNTFDGKME
jgi:hypothetical protein